jgi:hypothetical protein
MAFDGAPAPSHAPINASSSRSAAIARNMSLRRSLRDGLASEPPGNRASGYALGVEAPGGVEALGVGSARVIEVLALASSRSRGRSAAARRARLEPRRREFILRPAHQPCRQACESPKPEQVCRAL